MLEGGERHLGCAIENVLFIEASMHMIHIRICKRNPQEYSIHVQMHHMFVFQQKYFFHLFFNSFSVPFPQKIKLFLPIPMNPIY